MLFGQNIKDKNMKITIILMSAHTGLSTAVVLLNKKGTKKAKDLAKILDAADKGILAYLTSSDEV
jgi:hypothetical protein